MHLLGVIDQPDDVEIRSREGGDVRRANHIFQIWHCVLELEQAAGERATEYCGSQSARAADRLGESVAVRGSGDPSWPHIHDAHLRQDVASPSSPGADTRN